MVQNFRCYHRQVANILYSFYSVTSIHLQGSAIARRIQGLRELDSEPTSELFDAEKLAFRNGFDAGEREAEKNVIEDDAVSAHQYNTVQDKQQSLLQEEARWTLQEDAALQRTAMLEAMEHSKLAAWSAKIKAEAKLLGKAQQLKEEESRNLKRTAGIETTYANSLRSRAQQLRAAAAQRLSRLAAHHEKQAKLPLMCFSSFSV